MIRNFMVVVIVGTLGWAAPYSESNAKTLDKNRAEVIDKFANITTEQSPLGGTAICRGSHCTRRVRPVRIRRLKSQKNQITDDQTWMTQVGFVSGRLTLDRTAQLFPKVPLSMKEKRFVFASCMGVGQPVTTAYGIRPPRYRWTPSLTVLVSDYLGNPMRVFDLTKLKLPTAVKDGDETFVNRHIQYAEARGNVLYLSLGHKTYAASSKGQNAHILAFDIKSGALLWQSEPLVSNANNFVFVGDVIIAGYGFTAEPDFIYQINRYSGKTLKRLKVKSGPDYFFLKPPGLLHVRTYDTNYLFQLTR
jgi:hypothetical protein